MKQIDRGEVDLISQEVNMRLNTDKRVIHDMLLGSLPQLFDKYFKNRINKDFSAHDLQVLSAMMKVPDKVAMNSNATDIHNRATKVKLTGGSVKNNNYITFGRVKCGYVVQQLIPKANFYDADPECIVGASSVDNAVWFHLINDAADVCNGAIYTRSSSIKKLILVSTFEVNPFIISALPEKKELYSAQVNKPQLNWNPNWLVHTLANMEKYIFAKLIA